MSEDDGKLRLPAISPMATSSFTDLFDQFVHFESQDDMLSPPKGNSSPATRGDLKVQRTDALYSHGNTTTFVSAPNGRHGVVKAITTIARNDSIGSSVYSSDPKESDDSPLISRHSSTSSVLQELPGDVKQGSSTESKLNTVTARPSRPRSTAKVSGPLTLAPEKSRFTSSSIVVLSVPPNLDKPLPLGPGERMGGQYAKLSLQSQSSPQLLLDSNQHHPAPLRAQSTAPPAERSGLVQELPTWAPGKTRGARLGEAVASGMHRRRAKSETLAQEYRLLLEQHSPDLSHDIRRSSATASTSQQQKKPRLRTQQQPTYSPIAAATAERVIYRIMYHVDSVQDLQSAALVSKGFRRTFQRNESKLVSHLMFKLSRPAWEMRRSILALKGTNVFKLKDYQRDMSTIGALRSYILNHCRSSCRPSTILGLVGQDEPHKRRVEEALWRIWTFCTLFRNDIRQSFTSQTEMDWLNGGRGSKNKSLGAGFAIGNGKGLSMSELEDVTEMWQSLHALVSGFHGREQEAREAGVFDNWCLNEVTPAHQHLLEWTSYLLTLGPRVVLSISPCSFDKAKMLGLTTWTPPPQGQTRSTFLASAVAQVYQERILEEATVKAKQTQMPTTSSKHRPSRSCDGPQLTSFQRPHQAAAQSQGLRIDTSDRRRPTSVIVGNTAPMEIRPDCDPANKPVDARRSHFFPASPTVDPTAFYSLGMTPTASAKLGATLFPMDYARSSPRVPFRPQERSAAPNAEVVDPVDKAMALLVNELGFREASARKALAMCDTGSGIDVPKAIELLVVESRRDPMQDLASPVELPTPTQLEMLVPFPNGEMKSPAKEYCNGQCPRTSTMGHSRNQSGGNRTDPSVSPVSADSEVQDTISPLITSPMSLSSRSPKIGLTRGPSKSKTWKILGKNDGSGKRRSTVLGIEEYQAKVERRRSMRVSETTAATAAALVAHGMKASRVSDGLGKNLLGLGLGIDMVGIKVRESEVGRVQRDKVSGGCLPRCG